MGQDSQRSSGQPSATRLATERDKHRERGAERARRAEPGDREQQGRAGCRKRGRWAASSHLLTKTELARGCDLERVAFVVAHMNREPVAHRRAGAAGAAVARRGEAEVVRAVLASTSTARAAPRRPR